jgi:hypothetical protein
VRERTAIAILALALVVTACSAETESEPAPVPSETTVAEFLDLSLPRQSDVAERFYERDESQRCSNVNFGAGPSSEFMGRIRTRALGTDENAPISKVMLEFCEDG